MRAGTVRIEKNEGALKCAQEPSDTKKTRARQNATRSRWTEILPKRKTPQNELPLLHDARDRP